MWILRGCELSFYTRLPVSASDCCVNDCPDAGQETSEDNHDEEEESVEEEKETTLLNHLG